jgi:hypothetical protein
MDKQFSRIRAYILVKEVATMVVKINSKPIVVREEEVKKSFILDVFVSDGYRLWTNFLD